MRPMDERRKGGVWWAHASAVPRRRRRERDRYYRFSDAAVVRTSPATLWNPFTETFTRYSNNELRLIGGAAFVEGERTNYVNASNDLTGWGDKQQLRDCQASARA